MASFFDFVKAPSLEKYKYDLSNEIKFSGKVGQLIPYDWDFLSPGDTVRKNSSLFLRTAPLIHPIYQRMNIDIHHFFVPLRLIWDDFETFITGFDQKTGLPNENINHPKIILKPISLNFSNYYALFEKTQDSQAQLPIFATSNVADYLGIPVNDLPFASGYNNGINSNGPDHPSSYENAEFTFSALPFRAYQKVFNDYYRDSIKENEIQFDTDSLNIVIDNNFIDDVLTSRQRNIFDIRNRAFSKDYFTSSQPTPQLGEDVSLPSPVVDYGQRVNSSTAGFTSNVSINSTGYAMNNGARVGLRSDSDTFRLSDGVNFTINKLRELFGIQKWRDTGNKFGSRYKEQVLGHFGVETPDARLQRAQFLAGGRIPLMINQVSQLSEGTEDSPLGNQAGQGMASGADNYFEYDVKEHGILISIISVLPENTYYRGIEKKFKLFDRFDFPFPEFATLGEQEVSSQELNVYYPEHQTYGYQERYANFKTKLNRAHGEFTNSLRNFYMASTQVGDSCLMPANLRCSPTAVDNVFAVSSREVDNVYFLINNDMTKFSPLPYINRITTDYA